MTELESGDQRGFSQASAPDVISRGGPPAIKRT